MMEKIPPEILLMIFESLDINSLLRCRKVCRKWFFITKSIKITSLAVSDSFDNVGNYFHSNKPIKQSNLLTTTNLKFLRSKFMKSIVIKLKQLYIRNAPYQKNSRFTFESLNELINLEQLEVDFLKTRRFALLKLNKLKILTIKSGTNLQINLATPNLAMFKTQDSLDNFLFEKPAELTDLSIEHCEVRSLNQFKNLTSLCVKRTNTFFFDPKEMLTNLANLKVLNVKEISRNKANELLKQLKILRRLNFEFYVSGVHIETADDVELFINDSYRLSVDLTQTFSENFLKLSKIVPWTNEIDYSKFISQDISDQFIQDFFKRFINIRKVNITFESDQKVDLNLLKKFIEKCTYIDQLFMINVSLGQSFFDTLHVVCPYLSFLKIEEKEPTLTNIDFLFNHQHLINFSINQQATYEQIQRAFKMPSFEVFTFKMQNRLIQVSTSKDKKFKLTISSNEGTFTNKNAMFEFLKDALFSDLNYAEVKNENEEEKEIQKKSEETGVKRFNFRKRRN